MPNALKIRINGMMYESVDDESLINDIKTLKDELVLDLMPSVLASFIFVRDSKANRFAAKSADDQYAVLGDVPSKSLMRMIKVHNTVKRIREAADIDRHTVPIIRELVSSICEFATTPSLLSNEGGIYVVAEALSDVDGNIIARYNHPSDIKLSKDLDTGLVDLVVCVTRLSDMLSVAFPVESDPPGYSKAPSDVQFSIT